MAQDNRVSILQMVNGAISERVDYEVKRVVDNILDVNTDPTAKRKITLTIELKPSKDRGTVSLKSSAKSTLAPTVPIESVLAVTSDRNGEMVIAEITPQVPGQVDIEGNEQAAPKLLKIAQL